MSANSANSSSLGRPHESQQPATWSPLPIMLVLAACLSPWLLICLIRSLLHMAQQLKATTASTKPSIINFAAALTELIILIVFGVLVILETFNNEERFSTLHPAGQFAAQSMMILITIFGSRTAAFLTIFLIEWLAFGLVEPEPDNFAVFNSFTTLPCLACGSRHCECTSRTTPATHDQHARQTVTIKSC
ncbi:uncharacterized protein LTR77_009432 [Saxophila tyrrhenica]|uniref:Uncharacterized protein n=1 Tax=Saxophila tyrrhenica TaxID=1690608 RepID=A0AAV9P0D3_9PEZI|nr:hypothetical protein LTR77_009432 [Saxophila tyrrhenica]